MGVELEPPVVAPAPYDEIGEAEEKNMALDIHSKVCFNIVGSLYVYSTTHDLGHFFDSSATYSFPCSPPKRIPDASFVSYQKLPALRGKELNVTPDLAVEVVSKNDDAFEVQEKIRHYREVGVKLIWIVYTNTKEVLVFRSNSFFSYYFSSGDELDGENILPDFKLPLANIFRGIESSQTLDRVE